MSAEQLVELSKRIDKWAEQLLDTGKRNNLVSFKDRKLFTLEILKPSAKEIFQEFSSDNPKPFTIFDPAQILDNENNDYDDSSASDTNSDSRENKRIYNKNDFLNKFSNEINSSQVLAYSTSGNPVAAARNIMKKSNEIMKETGINVAYIAFGFIHWKDTNYADTVRYAPILLIPIQITNKSLTDPYRISVFDDEILINKTFSCKLNNEYGITLPEYENGTTLEEYFESVQNLVSKLGWEISKECKIGLFSFAKINMYMDLKNNKGKILNNLIVNKLLGGSADSYDESDEDIDESEAGNDPIIDLCNVVDADSSQIDAIEMAKSGKSFVLQGPPGTGKSQTITNIIAECLNDGKKVLFVSEKLAALKVVYNKMQQVGIADFCLQLHSNKANKKDVIKDICNNFDIQKNEINQLKVDEEINVKVKAKEKLDSYDYNLHKVNPVINKSLYDLYECLAKFDEEPDIICDVQDISQLGPDYLDDATNLLIKYVDYLPTVGYDYHDNPWYGYLNRNLSIMEEMRIKNSVSSSVDTLEKLSQISNDISKRYNIYCKNLVDIFFWSSFFELVGGSHLITPVLLNKRNFDIAYDSLQKLQSISKLIYSLMQNLSDCNDDIYKLNGVENYSDLKHFGGALSRIFNSDYKKIVSDIRLCKKVNKKPKYYESVLLMKSLSDYQNAMSEYIYIESSIKSLLGPAYKGIYTDWNYVNNQMEALKNLIDRGYSFEPLEKYPSFLSESKSFIEYSNQIAGILSENNLQNLNYVFNSFDKKIVDFNILTLEDAKTRLNCCLSSINGLKYWCGFRDLLVNLKEIGILAFINDVIKNNVNEDSIVGTFKKQFYLQWIDLLIRQNSTLSQFSRLSQDRAVKEFAEKDIEQFKINQIKLREKLSSACPESNYAASGSSLSILLRENQKSRSKKNIRELLEEAGALVQKVKPCFMMSPLSVSTYLDYDSIKFDIVIFDEASQMFPWDAICAISRAKQAVIVGDSKQMPPTNFFSTVINNGEDDDEDDDDVRSFDSILDLASVVLPQVRLSWHYRSRCEQLIAFSNKNFYDNKLISFPSSQFDSEGLGIDYYYVNGEFDRSSHNNRKEAEYVVDLIYKNIDKYPNRSLGVVAFSQSQQNLIDKLLFRRRQSTPEKEFFFDENKEDAFFIKNLETVQGDERDTIIFSIGYGPDSKGILSLNFGPLNKEGGERRLNVAVTRAKYNIQVVSSMHAMDIDLSRTESEGVRLLREYLDFAENGEIALQRSESVGSTDQFDSDFEYEVCEFLRNHGFSVDTQVGCSGFRIDLGLKMRNSSNYLLAIECDGATYHSSKNARDRDRLRQTILENMGWKFYRIWSTEWFRNKLVEQEKLLHAANDAVKIQHIHELNSSDNNLLLSDEDTVLSNSCSDDLHMNDSIHGKHVMHADLSDKCEENMNSLKEKSVENLDDIAQPVDNNHFSFEKYKMAGNTKDCKDIFDKHKSIGFKEIVKDILEVEAPLSENLLLQRIVWYFQREKVSSAVQKSFDIKMRGCEDFGIIRRNGFMYLKDAHIAFRLPGDILRDFKQIAPEEIGEGMLEIISKNISVSKDGLYRFMIGQYGKKRLGRSDTEALDNALDMLLKSDQIVDDDGQIRLS